MQQSIKNNKRTQKGYILIELAIVLVVLSFIIAAMVPIFQNYLQRNAVTETKQRMEVISKALSSYVQTRWRLPCPAAPTAPAGTQLGVERTGTPLTANTSGCTGGVGNEPLAYGIIPYRTLGLPEQYAKDGYGNFFTYVVSPDFTVDNRLGVQADLVNIRLSHLVGEKLDNITAAPIAGTNKVALLPRAQFCAPLANTGTDLQVNNQNGNPLFTGLPRSIASTARSTSPDPNLNRNVPVTAVALAIVSHGQNGEGAYQSDGSQLPSLPAGTSEEITSNNTNRFVQIEVDVSNLGGTEYDDIVVFYTQDEIYAAAGSNSCEHL